MGKKLFFLSLIILSVAMGAHWQKNRPKTKSGPAKPRVALNLQDLQIQDNEAGDATGGETDQDKPVSPDDQGDGVDPEKTEDGEQKSPDQPEGSESASEEPAGDAVASAQNTLNEDPIIFALRNMSRNPFERSPYAQLVLELQKKEEVAALPTEKKSVKLLPANFSATIQTRKELAKASFSRTRKFWISRQRSCH